MKYHAVFLPFVFALVILLTVVTPSSAQDSDADIPLPKRLVTDSTTTYGKVVNILAYETDNDGYYYRVTEMPKNISWFHSESNRTFAIVQQAASKNWLLRIWHDEKGRVKFVKSIVSHSGNCGGASVASDDRAAKLYASLAGLNAAPKVTATPTSRGATGKIKDPVSTVCGKSFTQAQVLTSGLFMPIAFEYGVANPSDPSIYEFFLYAVVEDSSGKLLIEGGSRRRYKAGDPIDWGLILGLKDCFQPGMFTLEAVLYVTNPDGSISRLGKGACTFQITQ